MIDEVDSYQLDYSDEITQILSEQAKKTLKQTFQLNQSFFCSVEPFVLQMSVKPKKLPFSIELQTFA